MNASGCSIARPVSRASIGQCDDILVREDTVDLDLLRRLGIEEFCTGPFELRDLQVERPRSRVSIRAGALPSIAAMFADRVS
jgi:hypothetical protein